MQKHRYKTSFIITAILYVSLAYAIWYGSSNFTKKPNLISDAKTITISLSEFKPQQKTKEQTPQEIIETPSKVEQLQEEEKTEEKPKDTKEEQQKPIEKEKLKTPDPIKPIEQKLTTTKTNIKKSIKKKSKRAKTKHKKHKKTKRVLKSKAINHKQQAKAKATLLSHIRYKINRSKIYPRAAKKRRIQGRVKARFRVLKNGQVSNLQLSGSSIFYNATKKAIQKAFPIDTKGATTLLPLDVSITLRYNLTQN